MNYRFDAEAEDEQEQSRVTDQGLKHSLGIPQTEIFDMFQVLRVRLLAWLKAHPDPCNDIMEGILREISQAKDEGQQLVQRHWACMPGLNCEGRFVPSERGCA